MPDDTSMPDDIYVELAEHLDKAVAGVPMAPSLLEILKILFPGEEAEVALRLSIYESRTLAECRELIPEKADRLEGLLDSMARRGTVFTGRKPGSERVYRLFPVIVGFSEAPFFKGEDTPEKRELARHWVKYMDEGFGAELGRAVPLIRVVPIAESLEDGGQVLPYDAIARMLDETSFMAVANCPCRQMNRFTGAGCERTLENCMHFGGMGRYVVEQGMGRRIDKDEALRILRQATEQGLVHVCDNVLGVGLRTICNCCSCCCAFLRAKLDAGHDTVSRSNYVARVDADLCTACAVCEERCPMNAVTVDGDAAVVDIEACIGCGVCTPTCGGDEAIRLVLRDEVKPPPGLMEFFEARMKK